eukprot:GEMP01115788.1.p2 GENE.GEMP01115788.1~~GEMP01115788.1.p2  ORF type:complete len:103 (-),score=20.04 GEMP01115788.1:57-365(-)
MAGLKHIARQHLTVCAGVAMVAHYIEPHSPWLGHRCSEGPKVLGFTIFQRDTRVHPTTLKGDRRLGARRLFFAAALSLPPSTFPWTLLFLPPWRKQRGPPCP